MDTQVLRALLDERYKIEIKLAAIKRVMLEYNTSVNVPAGVVSFSDITVSTPAFTYDDGKLMRASLEASLLASTNVLKANGIKGY